MGETSIQICHREKNVMMWTCDEEGWQAHRTATVTCIVKLTKQGKTAGDKMEEKIQDALLN